jgi:hypothetical protein
MRADGPLHIFKSDSARRLQADENARDLHTSS